MFTDIYTFAYVYI